MARYIDVDLAIELHKGELWAWDVCDLGEFLAEVPTADVVPRAEVAREIFEEIEEAVAYRRCGNGLLDDWLEDDISELKKKYTEGEK